MSECKDNSCPAPTAPASGAQTCCPACKGACGGDPATCASIMWTGAFFQAMMAAKVELLKGKIIKAWGPMLNQSADATLESMGICWQSMLAQAKAKSDLHDKLADIMAAKP